MLIFEPIDIFFDFQCRTNVIFFPHFFLLQSLIINIDRLHEWQSFKDKDQSMNLVYHVENHTWRQTCTLMCLDDDSFPCVSVRKSIKLSPSKIEKKIEHWLYTARARPYPIHFMSLSLFLNHVVSNGQFL